MRLPSCTPFLFLLIAVGCSSSVDGRTILVPADGAASDDDTASDDDAASDDDTAAADEPPTVEIQSPEDGDVVSGIVRISAVAMDDYRVARIEFYADDVRIGEDASVPFGADWDATAVTAGSHTLRVVAYDTIGQTDEASITVTVEPARS